MYIYNYYSVKFKSQIWCLKTGRAKLTAFAHFKRGERRYKFVDSLLLYVESEPG